jgi:hypothetical protein
MRANEASPTMSLPPRSGRSALASASHGRTLSVVSSWCRTTRASNRKSMGLPIHRPCPSNSTTSQHLMIAWIGARP